MKISSSIQPMVNVGKVVVSVAFDYAFKSRMAQSE